MRTILIDNYDSYTYNLFQLMAVVFGQAPVVLANDAQEWDELDLSQFDAAVISPGPGTPSLVSDRGAGLERLLTANLPTLGVCFGHQALGWWSGGEVVSAPSPQHGHLERIRHNGRELFQGIAQDFVAVRYHSLCLSDPLPSELEATAWAEDGVIMGLRHRHRPWWGVQFHPESIASEYGAAILENFATLAREHHAESPLTGATPEPRYLLRQQRLDFLVDTEVLFDELFADRQVAFWLDSSRVERGISRFSFLGDSGGALGEVLSARVNSGSVERLAGEDLRRSAALPGSIFQVLDQRLQHGRLHQEPEIPFDLAGGYVGYFGYELKAENGSPNRHIAEQPDALWMLATRMIAVDHQAGQMWVLALADANDQAGTEAEDWVSRTATAVKHLRGRAPRPTPQDGAKVDIAPLLDRPRAQYLEDVRACLSKLHTGDSYEICLTNLIDTGFEGSPLEAYRRLRRHSPAPYAAYLRFEGMHVLCSSPERFVKIDPQGVVESKPIKGTARRDPHPDTDEALRANLASSKKARAENLMIVDLLRNDLGRICEAGTIRVPSLMEVESYAAVHQLVSTVRGRLKSGLSVIDAVRACFPAGSMTGAPKLRTMDIIQELETRARGPYSGALGFLGFQGTADLNVVIRTAVIEGDRAVIGTGGAIVLESEPHEEFSEIVLKADAVVSALYAETHAASAATPE